MELMGVRPTGEEIAEEFCPFQRKQEALGFC